MDFPKRKQLRLKDYDYSRNNAYFITICTYHRAHLFGEITAGDTLAGAGPSMSPPPRGAFRLNQTHEMLEKWLRELENKYEAATIDSHVVMPDHIHFLLFIEGASAPLPEILQWFKTQTTNEYIKGVKRGDYPPFDKRVWQRSYYEHIVRSEQDLYETRTYIEENPSNGPVSRQIVNSGRHFRRKSRGEKLFSPRLFIPLCP